MRGGRRGRACGSSASGRGLARGESRSRGDDPSSRYLECCENGRGAGIAPRMACFCDNASRAHRGLQRPRRRRRRARGVMVSRAGQGRLRGRGRRGHVCSAAERVRRSHYPPLLSPVPQPSTAFDDLTPSSGHDDYDGDSDGDYDGNYSSGDMCKHILNAQVAIRAPCCRQWYDCAECHADAQDHKLRRTTEMAFMCKKCRKAFRKDMSAYEESDEYCPNCDNHYVIDAKTPQAALGLEGEDPRIDARMLRDERVQQVSSSSIFNPDLTDRLG